MHLAHAKTLFPEARRVHCRLGRLLTFLVGLYFPLSFTNVLPIEDFFSQIEQIFSAIIHEA